MNEVRLTDDSFEKEVEKFDGVALVDFWATLCAPCKLQRPIVEELAEDYKNNKKIKFCILNVEANIKTTTRFHISSVPTIIFFKDGKPKDQMSGVSMKKKLVAALDKLI